jgi:hypothetical protein
VAKRQWAKSACENFEKFESNHQYHYIVYHHHHHFQPFNHPLLDDGGQTLCVN